jgi:hypothetical protein
MKAYRVVLHAAGGAARSGYVHCAQEARLADTVKSLLRSHPDAVSATVHDGERLVLELKAEGLRR